MPVVISDGREPQPCHPVQHSVCCANLAYLEASLGQLMKCLLFTEFSSDLSFGAGIGIPFRFTGTDFKQTSSGVRLSTYWRLSIGKCNFSFKSFTIAKKQSTNTSLPGHPRDAGESQITAGGARPAGGPGRRPRLAARPGWGWPGPRVRQEPAGPQRDLLPLRSCLTRCLCRCLSSLGAPGGSGRRGRRWGVRAAAGGRCPSLSLAVSPRPLLSHLSLQTRTRPHPEDPRDGEGEEGGGSGRTQPLPGRFLEHPPIIPLLTFTPHRFLFGLP